MGEFHQCAKRNIIWTVGSVLGAAFFSWLYFDGDGNFLHLMFGFVFLLSAAKMVFNLLQKEPALAFDRRGLRFRTLTGVDQVDWDEVHDIAIETYRYRGAEIRFLVVKCDGGLFGAKRRRLAFGTLDLPGGSEALALQMLHNAWVAAVGETGVAMAGAGETGWGAGSPTPARATARPEPSTFDADEAFRRYQDRQASSTRSNPQVVAATSPVGSEAIRPVFGRKVR